MCNFSCILTTPFFYNSTIKFRAHEQIFLDKEELGVLKVFFSKKKIVNTIISLALVTSLVGGCGLNADVTETTKADSSSPAAATEDDVYTIQILTDPQSTVKYSTDTAIGKVIKEKFNIVFEYIPTTGDQREKQNLMLSSGDYPEVMRLEGDDMVKKYIAAGAAISLDDYVANSEYFADRFAEQIPYWKVASPDGKLYKWEINQPQDFDVNPEMNDIGVRTDALEAQGWPNLVTEDDWFNFLQTAMEQYPTTNGEKTVGMVIPLAESWGPSLTTEFIEKGGITNDQGTNDAVLWNQIEQQWEPAFTNADFIQNLRFFNRLYRAGLLDPDSFTDTLDQCRAKVTSGRALSMWYITWEIGGANTQLAAEGNENMQYINMPIRSNDQEAAGLKRQIRVETTRPFDSVIITKNCKDPDRLFALIDWIMSDEGQILLQSGIEGEQYDIVDGKRVPTQDYLTKISTDPTYSETVGFNGALALLGTCKQKGDDGIAYNLSLDPNYMDELFLTDRQKEAYKALGWENSKSYWLETGEIAPSGLASTCSLDPNSEEAKINEKFMTWRVTAGTKLITAETEEAFEATLADLMVEYNKMDIQKVVDKYNEILAANKANLDSMK